MCWIDRDKIDTIESPGNKKKGKSPPFSPTPTPPDYATGSHIKRNGIKRNGNA